MRTASSSATFVSKYLAIPAFAFVTGYFALAIWRSDIRHGVGGAPPAATWAMLLFMIGGTAIFCWVYARIKRVRFDQREVLVSNYFREIRVPLRDVRAIVNSPLVAANKRLLIMEFGCATEFGEHIHFLPGAPDTVAQLLAVLGTSADSTELDRLASYFSTPKVRRKLTLAAVLLHALILIAIGLSIWFSSWP